MMRCTLAGKAKTRVQKIQKRTLPLSILCFCPFLSKWTFMHAYIFAETRGESPLVILLCNWTFGIQACVCLCNCLLKIVVPRSCIYVRKLVWFVCLFVASFVSRLVQEDTFVASACWRKPGLAAAEDTIQSGGGGGGGHQCRGASSQLGLLL